MHLDFLKIRHMRYSRFETCVFNMTSVKLKQKKYEVFVVLN